MCGGPEQTFLQRINIITFLDIFLFLDIEKVILHPLDISQITFNVFFFFTFCTACLVVIKSAKINYIL